MASTAKTNTSKTNSITKAALNQPAPEKTKSQKLTFFSTMLIAVGATIGAGIFFKNQSLVNNTGGNLIGVIAAWSIAIIALIAMSFTFGELVSKSKKYGGEGFIGWVRQFCGERLHKGLKNFMVIIYFTGNAFFMPYYACSAIQDSHEVFATLVLNKTYTPINEWIMIGIALVIMWYFISTSMKSIKFADAQNKIFMGLKFIPIAFAAIGGIVLYSMYGSQAAPAATTLNSASITDLTSSWVGFGVVACIPAIFFAYDGFYSATGSFGKMKDPKKGAASIAIGIVVISAIYILVSLGLLLANKDTPTISGLSLFGQNVGNAKVWGIIIFIMNCLIVMSIFGAINGIDLYSCDYFKSVIMEETIPFSRLIKRKFNMEKDNKGVIVYCMVLFTIVFCMFTGIGMFYFNTWGGDHGATILKIYSLGDLLTNWTALIVFGVIGLAILSALIQKTKEIKKNKAKHSKNDIIFLIAAIVSLIVISIAYLYQTAQAIWNAIAYSLNYFQNRDGLKTNDYRDEVLIPQYILVALFILFHFVIFFNLMFTRRKTNNDISEVWLAKPKGDLLNE
ncbi:MAG: APC family permease [Mycoplasmoidaceae bacterium]|nr:MAG: APC family permease [Mycoplasmoidaceae bacterium]